MLSIFQKLISSFKFSLYPDRCPYCNKIVENQECACSKCKKDIPSIGITQGVASGYRCCSPLTYNGKFKRAVLNFKFRNRTQYSPQFAYLLAKQIKQSYPDMIFDYITYVPMHKKDLRKRGYNQSELLARDLSELLQIPYKETLEKTKQIKPQHETKSVSERRANIKGAFKVIDKSKIKGKSILLLDDIVTTGATLGECAKVLDKAKPAFIRCVTLLSVANLY